MIGGFRLSSEHKKIQALKKEFFAEADERYVKIESCNETQSANNKRFANDDKRIEIISNEFGVIKKLMWAIASASIGSLVAAIFELMIG
jgi:hypothetical protein